MVGTTDDAENTKSSRYCYTEESTCCEAQATVSRDTELLRLARFKRWTKKTNWSEFVKQCLSTSGRNDVRAALPDASDRNRVDHPDRDLSNLDEIFEGPRRRP